MARSTEAPPPQAERQRPSWPRADGSFQAQAGTEGGGAATPAATAAGRGSSPALRLVHFTDSLEPSGVGEHIACLARELSALGHEQALVCPDTPAAGSLLERCARMGLQVYPWCVRDEHDTADYGRLVRLLRRRPYDLFHNHAGITWEGCWGTFAAAEAGTPVVCTEHLPYLITDGAQRLLKLRASRLVARTIAVSRGVARSLLERGVVPADRVSVVWNGIDLAPYAPLRAPERRASMLGVDPHSFLVVCVSRLTPQKGHAVLLDAVALARRQAPTLTLALAGDGPLRQSLEAQAAALGIEAAVRFLGRYERVGELLRCADALVQASAFEGLPLSVLEGMAAALPVVVTDTVGNNETVVPGESGLLVPPDDPAALAGALVRLRSDPGLAHRLGIQARRRVEREFTARLMAQRTRAAYQHALAVAGVRRAPVPA